MCPANSSDTEATVAAAAPAQPKRYRSLGRSLVLWFMVLSLVPMSLVAWIGYREASQSLIQAAQEELQQSAVLTVRYIANWFDYRLTDLNAQAEATGNVRLLQELTMGLAQNGKPLAQYVKSFDWARRVDGKQDDLVNLNRRYDYIYDLYLIDTEGNILYTVARESDWGTNLLEGPYADTLFADAVRVTLNSGETRFSGLELYDPSNDSVAGFIIAPLLDEFGSKLGVFAIQLRLGQVLDLLQRGVGGRGSLTHYVVGEDARLRSAMRDDWSEVLTRKLDTEQVRLWQEAREAEAGSRSITSGQALEYLGPEGQRVIGTYHELKLANVNWALISEINRDEALAAADWLGRVIIFLVTLTAIAVIGLAVYLGRRITRPISALASASMSVAAGATDQQVEVEADNEIGKLADAFNHMLQARKVHEEALEESTKKAQQALANLAEQEYALDQHAIVAVTDIEGTITFVNDRFTKISGYERDELIGRNHRILKSGHHDKAFFRDLYLTISKGRVWHGEICNRAKDGHLYWVDSTMVPFKGSNGKPKSYIAIRADITERKQAELELAESRRQLQLVIESTAVGIWDWQVQSGETVFNDRWAEIVGYTLDELSPVSIDTWSSLCEPEDLVHSGQLLEAHWRGETEHYVCEARMRHKQGHWVWVHDTGKVVEWHEDGKPKRMIGTHMDITDRKQVETALIEAKETAEAAVKSKSDFLASMSHEIRTPMNGVLGMLGLLIDSELDADQRHKAILAQTSAESLLGLINDILDFSKVDAGKLELETLDFDLRSSLGEFAESMALRAQDKGLEVVLDLTAVECSMVRGDPGRLRQILTNLVGNAIKFTAEGEVVIQAEDQEVAGGRELRCRVKDTGIGIPEDKQRELFDAFTQVDASNTRQYGGTGLGLSIVKNLCELMGGDISVSSEPGKGSCFEFTVVLQAGRKTRPLIPDLAMNEQNLLVVDDNDTNREVLRGQLEHWGASVQEAVDGPSALELLDAHVQSGQPLFEVAFLDMQMPDMDGAELGRRIRVDRRFDDMKLVLMTSISNRGDARFFADLGFSAYFPKPATTSDLFDALSVVAEGGDALQQAAPLVTRHYLKSLTHGEGGTSGEMAKGFDWPVGAHLLMVEDNRINQEVALGVLRGMGLGADVAGNGVQALRALKQSSVERPYTLLLMDCQMPEMDGYETTRQIRAGGGGERYKSIAIVAMTANAMVGDREKCLAAGMNDYLAKPIARDLLYAKLLQWLSGVDAALLGSRPARVEKDPEHIVWDREGLLKRLLGQERLLGTLIDAFHSDIPAHLDGVQQAIDSRGADLLRRTAHTIKGVAANLGGIQLQRQAALMEGAARTGDMDEALGLLPGLQSAAQALLECLDQHRPEKAAADSTLAPMLDNVQLANRLHSLRQRLQKGDYIDPDELTTLYQACAGSVAQERLDQLSEQIGRFDSEAATRTLNGIVAELSNSESA